MLVLVNFPHYCSGANLAMGSGYTNIQIQEKCLNMFAHKLDLNGRGGGGGGGGGTEADL